MKNFTKEKVKFLLIFFIILIFFLSFSLFTDIPRIQRGGFFDDESIYYSMALSIAEDYDLKYTRADLARIYERFMTGPQGFFLKRGRNGDIFYAKSFAYPLFVAPFVKLFKFHGFFVFHSILIFLILLAGYHFFKYSSKLNIFIPVTFLFASITWIFFFWITPEFFNFAIVFFAVFFWLYKIKKKEEEGFSEKNLNFFQNLTYGKYSDLISAILIGVATFSKLPNAIILLPIGLYYLFNKKFLKILLIGVFFLITIGIFFGTNFILTGDPNYMGGERKTFYFRFPFEDPETTFDNIGILHTSEDYWQRFHISPKTVIWNFFYFFFGRFSGIALYYFPAFLSLILFITHKKRIWETCLVITIFVEIFLYIVLIPDNYYGGGGTLGNRYFMNLYPLFFFLSETKKIKSIASEWLISLFFLGQIFLNPIFSSSYPGTHAKNYPFKLFPPEKTLVENFSTNTNPRAFRVPFGDPIQYWLYYLDDNFHAKEGMSFWTVGSSELEMILESPKKLKGIKIYLTNNRVNNNRVKIKVDGISKKYILRSSQVIEEHFPAIDGFPFKKHFLYHIKIYSQKGEIPYFIDHRNVDKRFMGVYVRIEVY
ncbi:MAG: hypothetical protein AB1410_05410 [Acidobacteriota bacterium]